MKRDTAITLSFRDRNIIVRRDSTYRTYIRTIDKMREIDRKLEKSFIQNNVYRMSYSIWHATYTNQLTDLKHRLQPKMSEEEMIKFWSHQDTSYKPVGASDVKLRKGK